jgi:hypothetical protein
MQVYYAILQPKQKQRRPRAMVCVQEGHLSTAHVRAVADLVLFDVLLMHAQAMFDQSSRDAARVIRLLFFLCKSQIKSARLLQVVSFSVLQLAIVFLLFDKKIVTCIDVFFMHTCMPGLVFDQSSRDAARVIRLLFLVGQVKIRSFIGQIKIRRARLL